MLVEGSATGDSYARVGLEGSTETGMRLRLDGEAGADLRLNSTCLAVLVVLSKEMSPGNVESAKDTSAFTGVEKDRPALGNGIGEGGDIGRSGSLELRMPRPRCLPYCKCGASNSSESTRVRVGDDWSTSPIATGKVIG